MTQLLTQLNDYILNLALDSRHRISFNFTLAQPLLS